MGMMRKTLSVATLGMVSFRSKGERLARAEAALADAEEERAAEALARAEAEHALADAAS